MTLDVAPNYIILGNFEKIKNLYVGERYVSRGQKWKLIELVDMNTGGKVNYDAGTRWQCMDVMLDLEDRYTNNRISLVIENEYGGRALVGYDRLSDDYYFFTQDSADEIKKTYGDRLYHLIVGGIVEIGMSENVAILSWGYPSERNRTIVGSLNHEQWVYGGGHYLYFENGRLTSIQN